ncbi:ABC transporter ATP-binding protein [Subtercola sp. RTI3]|uniref:sulfate/molybdate ABC transporter ATP-binding protein n=1 Tax=Subtercola sp. RTI3 TaxID=3048639 RepID=UPI002B22DE78|nr:ABC transporter ATP-binding protein [Subtercola sp. RTI3]MEA9987036.1 ABC transporter ATP-binding protein [Subtercola sp. RTI3]
MTFTFDARVASRDFDVSFTLEEGETVAVLGPNGAGKSTLLNLISGLLAADDGHAELESASLFDTRAGTQHGSKPPHQRAVALLAQEALLFPHLSVLNNVAFGPRSAGARRQASHAAARRWLAEVDGSEFENRRPAQLSGGQAQRIAVARALAAEPRLLLLDEPMAALDMAVTPAIRRMLKRVLAGRTALIVTHDILDAYTLADRVLVIERGRVVEDGPTREVLERPRTAFAAGIAGLSILSGVRTPTGLRTDDGIELAVSTGAAAANATEWPAPDAGTAVIVAVRPSAVTVSNRPPAAAVNAIEGVITDLEQRGDLVRVRTDRLAADLTARRVAELDLTDGSRSWFSFDPGAAALYPATRPRAR